MALFAAVVRAVEAYRHPEVWADIQQKAMVKDVSWRRPSLAYHDLYRRARSLKLTGWPG